MLTDSCIIASSLHQFWKSNGIRPRNKSWDYHDINGLTVAIFLLLDLQTTKINSIELCIAIHKIKLKIASLVIYCSKTALSSK